MSSLIKLTDPPKRRYYPALLDCLKTYDSAALKADVTAGLVVSIVALPLSIALAVAVHAPPQAGLYTAIIGGGIIALLGGSRMQVSGPTAAFVVILAPICIEHGILGLMVASMMAGVLLLIMGVTGLGALIKYVPYPVTMGFTTGIAVTIAAIQLKDLFGLHVSHAVMVQSSVPYTLDGQQGAFVQNVVKVVHELPDRFHLKMVALFEGFRATPAETVWHTGLIGLITVAILVVYPKMLKSLARKLPAPLVGMLVSVALAAICNMYLGWKIETIGTRFQGGMPGGFPPFNMALFTQFDWSYSKLSELFFPALAIAVLGAISSLLSAVVSDALSGTKHDSNSELIAQGIGNILSPMFGGIAVTGAIARTTTNVRNGARSPLAAVFHSLALLAMLLVAAPYASYIPMAALAAILIVVAYNMADVSHFRHMLKAPRSDTLVLLSCFLLTVFTDMAVAVMVGMVLASMLFMRRMSNMTTIDILDSVASDSEMQSHDLEKHDIPRAVSIYSVDGPFFFGASEKAINAMESIGSVTRVVILRLNRVPAIDATGLHALEHIWESLHSKNITLVLSGLRKQPRETLQNADFIKKVGGANVLPDIEWALVRCYDILGPDARNRPTGSTDKIVAPVV